MVASDEEVTKPSSKVEVTALLGLVTSSSEATIYLLHNGHVIDDFNLIARLSNFLVRSNHLSIP
jgi:hypothetical protein